MNYVGKLYTDSTTVDTGIVAPMLTGVSELGPVSNRALFVNAPKATPAGVYYVKY